MTVRSTQLAAYHSTAPFTGTVFTCPAGWRTIVKDVSAFNANATQQLIQSWTYQPATATQVMLITQTLQANTSGFWTGWIVLNPGDLVQVGIQLATASIWISGTLLRLTGAEPI